MFIIIYFIDRYNCGYLVDDRINGDDYVESCK